MFSFVARSAMACAVDRSMFVYSCFLLVMRGARVGAVDSCIMLECYVVSHVSLCRSGWFLLMARSAELGAGDGSRLYSCVACGANCWGWRMSCTVPRLSVLFCVQVRIFLV